MVVAQRRRHPREARGVQSMRWLRACLPSRPHEGLTRPVRRAGVEPAAGPWAGATADGRQALMVPSGEGGRPAPWGEHPGTEPRQE